MGGTFVYLKKNNNILSLILHTGTSKTIGLSEQVLEIKFCLVVPSLIWSHIGLCVNIKFQPVNITFAALASQKLSHWCLLVLLT